MKPTDIIFWRDEKFGAHRFYEIESVHLGAVGQMSIVGIRPLNEKPGRDIDGKEVALTYVPEPFLRSAQIFSREGAA